MARRKMRSFADAMEERQQVPVWLSIALYDRVRQMAADKGATIVSQFRWALLMAVEAHEAGKVLVIADAVPAPSPHVFEGESREALSDGDWAKLLDLVERRQRQLQEGGGR